MILITTCPMELIAQAPAEPRDSCRLLVVNRELRAVPSVLRMPLRSSMAAPSSIVIFTISSTISSPVICWSPIRRALCPRVS